VVEWGQMILSGKEWNATLDRGMLKIFWLVS
jgi:hypothetical protein